mmetsp:Transcript_2346/g.7485  ORF Transcript_2346/g.7485 Transcript_2346/m.7485 type:complete len:226 (+) Transcript_2346:2448-3125(+)
MFHTILISGQVSESIGDRTLQTEIGSGTSEILEEVEPALLDDHLVALLVQTQVADGSHRAALKFLLFGFGLTSQMQQGQPTNILDDAFVVVLRDTGQDGDGPHGLLLTGIVLVGHQLIELLVALAAHHDLALLPTLQTHDACLGTSEHGGMSVSEQVEKRVETGLIGHGQVIIVQITLIEHTLEGFHSRWAQGAQTNGAAAAVVSSETHADGKCMYVFFFFFFSI